MKRKQGNNYDEVVDKIYASLHFYADYEESFKIYTAVQPDHQLAKQETEEINKESLVPILDRYLSMLLLYLFTEFIFS